MIYWQLTKLLEYFNYDSRSVPSSLLVVHVVRVRVDVRVAVVVDRRVVVVVVREGVVTVLVEVAVTVLVTVMVLRNGGNEMPSP